MHDMTMARLGNNSRSIIQRCILLMFLIVVQVTGEENVTTCPGPLRYYKALGCTPIYANPNDTCAKAYNCSHLDNLSRDKCYANGHEYSIGETLRPEDSNTCDKNCTCVEGENYFVDNSTEGQVNFSYFDCTGRDYCFDPNDEHNTCLYRRTHGICCQNPCAIDDLDATCNDDGDLYFAGQFFTPKSNPKLYCLCLGGYTGENVEPYCQELKRDPCDFLFTRSVVNIYAKTPIIIGPSNILNPCETFDFIYETLEGKVVRKHDNATSISEEEHNMCRYGEQTFHIGDELYPKYQQVKCVCEVPPILSCKNINIYVNDI